MGLFMGRDVPRYAKAVVCVSGALVGARLCRCLRYRSRGVNIVTVRIAQNQLLVPRGCLAIIDHPCGQRGHQAPASGRLFFSEASQVLRRASQAVVRPRRLTHLVTVTLYLAINWWRVFERDASMARKRGEGGVF